MVESVSLPATPEPTPRSLSVAVTGSGGKGAISTGLVLLEAAAGIGLYGLMGRSAGPQIRGGEAAALLRLSDRPVDGLDDRFDVVVGLDWLNVARFADEVPLDADSLVLGDPAMGPVPESLAAGGARTFDLPLKRLAADVEGGRVNMVALGALAALLGIPASAVRQAVTRVLSRKGEAAVRAAHACLDLGLEQTLPAMPPPLPAQAQPRPRWNVSGNEAAGLGALQGGVRFVAAYPITPASEMLEWMAPRLERVGGALLQAEDELASINMVIGASFGGVPALTATSGPGLSLMAEGIGLAVASETPLVVVDVMRGGPSTGIPTKSEQSDLNLALYGLHGDAPHLVLAPSGIGDCLRTTRWAVELAERLQAPAIVLSDQSLGQTRAIIDQPAEAPAAARRATPDTCGQGYHRYEVTADGVSPMCIPGMAEGMYTADGLEHDLGGVPSSAADDHRAQLDKRLGKLTGFDFGPGWADIDGAGETCIVTWGSVSGVAREAGARLRRAGRPVRCIALRLLAPLRADALRVLLDEARRVLVVEQSHGAQFYHYLRSRDALPPDARSQARPGPLPLRPGEIVDAVLDGG